MPTPGTECEGHVIRKGTDSMLWTALHHQLCLAQVASALPRRPPVSIGSVARIFPRPVKLSFSHSLAFSTLVKRQSAAEGVQPHPAAVSLATTQPAPQRITAQSCPPIFPYGYSPSLPSSGIQLPTSRFSIFASS